MALVPMANMYVYWNESSFEVRYNVSVPVLLVPIVPVMPVVGTQRLHKCVELAEDGLPVGLCVGGRGGRCRRP